jgi:hypothetical protein
LTEREWKRIENTMQFILEQQTKFEAKSEANSVRLEQKFALADERFAKAERRMDRLERFADRATRNWERRFAKAEAETEALKAEMKSFLEALRRSAGNGGHRG